MPAGSAMRRSVVIALAMIACVVVAVAQERVDPYQPSPDDPYLVTVKTSPSSDGRSFMVEVTVTEKASGKVVHSPRVTMQPGVPAEVFSAHDNVWFETRVTVTADGKAAVVFKAFKILVQRTRVTS